MIKKYYKINGNRKKNSFVGNKLMWWLCQCLFSARHTNRTLSRVLFVFVNTFFCLYIYFYFGLDEITLIMPHTSTTTHTVLHCSSQLHSRNKKMKNSSVELVPWKGYKFNRNIRFGCLLPLQKIMWQKTWLFDYCTAHI